MEVRSSGPPAQKPPQPPPVKNLPTVPQPAQKPPQLPPANNQPAVPQPAQHLPPPPPPNIPVVPHKRVYVGAGLDDDGGVGIALSPFKRDTVDLNALTNQIINLLSNEFPQGHGGTNLPGSKRGLGGPVIPTTAKHISIPKSTGKPPRP